jgi:hypothetical protein
LTGFVHVRHGRFRLRVGQIRACRPDDEPGGRGGLTRPLFVTHEPLVGHGEDGVDRPRLNVKLLVRLKDMQERRLNILASVLVSAWLTSGLLERSGASGI